MRAVHIGIGHYDDLVVPRFLDIKDIADPRAERSDDHADFLIGKSLVQPRFLYADNLSFQRKDRLEHPVTPLLSRTACGVPLYDEQFAIRRVFRGAIR